MQLKSVFLAALLAACCCTRVVAIDNSSDASKVPLPPPPSIEEPQMTAEKRALIMQLMEVTQASKRVDAVVSQMMAAHQKQYPLMMAQIANSDKELSEAQKKQIVERAQVDSLRSSERLKVLFLQKINLGDVMDKVALVVYDKNFTESELKDLIAFYKTPTGQKALKQLPEVLKESMEMTSTLIAPQMGQIITQLMDEERARLKASGKAADPVTK